MSWKEGVIVVGGSTALFNETQMIGPNDWVRTQTAGVGPLLANGRALMGLQRSAQGAAGYVEDNLLDFPDWHDLVDPTTPRRNRGFEVRDQIINVIAAGVCQYAWGFHDVITANDITTLVGLGFWHGADFVLKTFLNDAPGNALPVRSIRTVQTAYLANVLHELAIIVDGWTKTITWQIDGVTVDSFVPFQAVDQTGGSAVLQQQAFRYRGFVPAAGNMSIYRYGHQITQPILTMREFP